MGRHIWDNFFLGVVCSLLVACGGGGGGGEGAVGSSNTLNSTGGVFGNNNLSIQIPSNTLQNPATVIIQELDKPPFIASNYENQISKTYCVNSSSIFYTINDDPIVIRIKIDANKSVSNLINENNTLVNVQFMTNLDGNFTFPVFGTISDNSISIRMKGFPNIPTYFTVFQQIGNVNGPIILNPQEKILGFPSHIVTYMLDPALYFFDFNNVTLNNTITEAEILKTEKISIDLMANNLNFVSYKDMLNQYILNNAKEILSYVDGINLNEPITWEVVITDKIQTYGGNTNGPFAGFSNLFYAIFIHPSEFDDNINNDDIKGGIKSVLAHEMFHKIFREYGYYNSDFQALNESMAALFGTTAGKNGELTLMKLHSPYPINRPLFKLDDGLDNYHYQGFLYYLAKIHLSNNLKFYNDFLIKYKNMVDPVWFLDANHHDPENRQIKAYESLDNVIQENSSTKLIDVFWDYIKNYGFEHNMESNPLSSDYDRFYYNEGGFFQDALQKPAIYTGNTDSSLDINVRRMSGNYIKISPTSGVNAISIKINSVQNINQQNIKAKIYWIKTNGNVNEYYDFIELTGYEFGNVIYKSGFSDKYNNIYILFGNLDYKNDIDKITVNVGFGNNSTVANWSKTYGGYHLDGATSIQKSIGDGYIVLGNTYSFINPQIFGGYPWIVKTSGDGTIVWQKAIKGANYQDLYEIQPTNDGGYIMTGRIAPSEFSQSDILVVKFNAGGIIEWQKSYGYPGHQYSTSIQTTADGGYIVIGIIESFNSPNNRNIWILKINPDGSVAWQKAYGGSLTESFESPGSIKPTSDGGYILVGSTGTFSSDFMGAIKSDIWVLKLKSDGTVAWEKSFGTDYADFGYNVEEDYNGGYIIKCNTISDGLNNTCILKLDSEGLVVWYKIFSNNFNAKKVLKTKDGGYLMVGDCDYPNSSAYMYSLCLAKLNSNGTIEWAKSYDSGMGSGGASVLQASDGGYIALGIIVNDALLEEWGGPAFDMWLFKASNTGDIAFNANSGIIMKEIIITSSDINMNTKNTNAVISDTNASINNTNLMALDTVASVAEQAP